MTLQGDDRARIDFRKGIIYATLVSSLLITFGLGSVKTVHIDEHLCSPLVPENGLFDDNPGIKKVWINVDLGPQDRIASTVLHRVIRHSISYWRCHFSLLCRNLVAAPAACDNQAFEFPPGVSLDQYLHTSSSACGWGPDTCPHFSRPAPRFTAPITSSPS